MPTAFAVPANNLTCIVGPGGYTSGSGTLTLAAGQGANFPALSGSQFYRITVIQAAYAYSPAVALSNLTIFRASSLATDTFGSVLAIEGTTDRNYAAGDSVDVRVTAGTISDIQDTIVNMQSNGSAVMSPAYNITATSVWQDTGFSIALPAAGTYFVTYDVRIVIGPASGGTGSAWMVVRLVQSDTSAVVPNTERLATLIPPSVVAIMAPTSDEIQSHSAFSAIVTVATACNVKLYAKREGTLTSWFTSRIASDSNGYTMMSYTRVL